ncbi:hypothetical protein KI387_034129, partial [Taxus chinensis]
RSMEPPQTVSMVRFGDALNKARYYQNHLTTVGIDVPSYVEYRAQQESSEWTISKTHSLGSTWGHQAHGQGLGRGYEFSEARRAIRRLD